MKDVSGNSSAYPVAELERHGATGRTVRLLRRLLLIIAAGYVLTYLILASLRAQYPFELEWMEGGMIDHIERIMQGKPLYVEPSLEFTPYIYPPLYFYAVAGLSEATSIGFGAARFVSILSSIWCLWCIFLLVARRTDNRVWGLVAAGLFAATYRIGGAWFDLARVDMLYLALLLSVLYVTLFLRSKGSGILAGLLMALACLTKQNGLVVAAALGVYYLLYDRRAAQYISVVAAAVGVVSLMWNLASDGWFFFYLFELPSNHTTYASRYLTFWTMDILPYLPVALALTVVWLLLFRSHRDRSETVFWFLITVSVLGSALMGRIHSGGYDNVLIPAYAVIAITFGLGLGAISRKVGEGLARGPRAAILYLLCLVQFGLLVYDPVANVPTDNDIRAGMALVRDIRQRSGDVLIPFHGRLGRLAGKRSWAHDMAMHDVLRGGESHGELLKGKIRAALKERRFSAIVLDHPWHDTFLEGNYEIEDSIRVCDECFYPVTGYRIRPEVILVPSK